MKINTSISLSALLGSSILLCGCSMGKTGAPLPESPEAAVTCVAVLPSQAPGLQESSLSEAEKKNLRNGMAIMDTLLSRQLADRTAFRFINQDQIDGLDSALHDDALGLSRRIGRQLNCNAVLQTSLLRYQERLGTELSAKEPASVALSYRLIELDKGQILCHGTYDEAQKSVMENLYTWDKATKRGFRWINGEDLLREGLQDSLGACKYLQSK